MSAWCSTISWFGSGIQCNQFSIRCVRGFSTHGNHAVTHCTNAFFPTFFSSVLALVRQVADGMAPDEAPDPLAEYGAFSESYRAANPDTAAGGIDQKAY